MPVELWIGAFFLVATAYKLSFFGPSPYPLNDGGLFIRFFGALADGGLAFPDCVVFNGSCLPFAYPPLSFYLTALLEIAGLEPLAIAKWYPLVVQSLYSALGLVLIGRLLGGVAERDFLWLVASVAFLFTYTAFEYLIMGGGIARATGALFWVLALLGAERMAGGLTFGRVLATGAATGAAVLSHPEWGPAAAIGVTVLLGCRAAGGQMRWRAAILGTVAVGVVSGALVTPWLWAVLSAHGTEPLAAASATSEWSAVKTIFHLLNLSLFPQGLVLLSAVGVVAALRVGQGHWLALALAFQICVPRSYFGISPLVVSPLAAFGALAIWQAAAGGLARLRDLGRRSAQPAVLGTGKTGETGETGETGRPERQGQPGLSPRAALARNVLSATVLACFLIALGRAQMFQRDTMRQPEPAAIAAMDWAAATLPADRRFVMITGELWFSDETEEWFAIRTPFELLSMVRGSEWLPDGEFARRNRIWSALNRSFGCGRILDALEAEFAAADIVFDINDTRCLERHPGWREIFRNGAAVLHERLPPR